MKNLGSHYIIAAILESANGGIADKNAYSR
jgi:hypothetical protein